MSESDEGRLLEHLMAGKKLSKFVEPKPVGVKAVRVFRMPGYIKVPKLLLDEDGD